MRLYAFHSIFALTGYCKLIVTFVHFHLGGNEPFHKFLFSSHSGKSSLSIKALNRITHERYNSEKNIKKYYNFNTTPLITHQRYQSEQSPEYLGKTRCTTTLKHDSDEDVFKISKYICSQGAELGTEAEKVIFKIWKWWKPIRETTTCFETLKNVWSKVSNTDTSKSPFIPPHFHQGLVLSLCSYLWLFSVWMVTFLCIRMCLY